MATPVEDEQAAEIINMRSLTRRERAIDPVRVSAEAPAPVNDVNLPDPAEYNIALADKVDLLTAEVERLRSIILNIHAGRYEARETVTPENAFAAYGRLNTKILAIYEQCRAALQEPRT